MKKAVARLRELSKSLGVSLDEMTYYLEDVLPQAPMVWKIGGESIGAGIDKVVSAAATLSEFRIPMPLIVVGWGRKLDARLGEKGFGKEYDKDGDRITLPGMIPYLIEAEQEAIETVHKACSKAGLKVQTFSPKNNRPFFIGTPKSDENRVVDKAGLTYQRLEPNQFLDRKKLLAGKKSPFYLDPQAVKIVSPLAVDERYLLKFSDLQHDIDPRRILNQNGDNAFMELALDFQPPRMLMVTSEGAIKEKGRRIPRVSIRRGEYDRLLSQNVVSGGMVKKLKVAHDIVTALQDYDSQVQIVGLDGILEELLTAGGSGTIVEMGHQIDSYPDFNRVNIEKIRSLINRSRDLDLVDDYFTRVKPLQVFVEGNCNAVAIVFKLGRALYVDKFFVNPDAQRNGYGTSLARAIFSFWVKENKGIPSVCLRAMPGNRKAVNFYHQKMFAPDQVLVRQVLEENGYDPGKVRTGIKIQFDPRRGYLFYSMGLTGAEYKIAYRQAMQLPSSFKH